MSKNKIPMKKFQSLKYPITPITDEATYMHFCALVEELDDLTFEDEAEEEKKFAHLDALTTLIEAYEAKHFQFNKIELTVVQVIEQTLEQLNLSKKDLSKILGSNRVSEIFSGKRDLSLAQIRTLHKELRIPTDLLVGV
jgi:HTH-type transcriptional regulator/antitoxin HigA